MPLWIDSSEASPPSTRFIIVIVTQLLGDGHVCSSVRKSRLKPRHHKSVYFLTRGFFDARQKCL